MNVETTAFSAQQNNVNVTTRDKHKHTSLSHYCES